MVGWLVSRTIFSGHLCADLIRMIDLSMTQLPGEHRRRRWQTPVGDQQQGRKRASDDDKIAGYGHCLLLLQIEQCRLVHDRDIRHELAHCLQTLL